MFRRLAAVALGLALIVGAMTIRSAKNSGRDREPSAAEVNTYEVFDDDQVTILCAQELAQLCEDLDLIVSATRVEPAWTTVKRLADGGALGADAWVTFRPLDEMATPPASAGRALGAPTTVARSPIVLAGPPATIAAIESACPDARKLLSCAGATDGVQLMLRAPDAAPAGALALAVVAGESAPAGTGGLRKPACLRGASGAPH